MTNSRKAFNAFRERLASEQHRPFAALGNALFLGINAFIWMMGLTLGAIPLAKNIYFTFIYKIAQPTQAWFDGMGWEGEMTALAINVGLTLTILYIGRNYIALAFRFLWTHAVEGVLWIRNQAKPASRNDSGMSRSGMVMTPPEEVSENAGQAFIKRVTIFSEIAPAGPTSPPVEERKPELVGYSSHG